MPMRLCEYRRAMDRVRLGQTIQAARLNARLSQGELAKRVRERGGGLAKTHPQTISDVERDVQFPGPELLFAICHILGITLLPVFDSIAINVEQSQSETVASNESSRRSAAAAFSPLTPPVTPQSTNQETAFPKGGREDESAATRIRELEDRIAQLEDRHRTEIQDLRSLFKGLSRIAIKRAESGKARKAQARRGKGHRGSD